MPAHCLALLWVRRLPSPAIPGRARRTHLYPLDSHGSKAPFACCRYMGDTAASKARCFCVLFVVHLVQILLRTATLSLLAATRGWLAAVYLVGDFLVLVGYKAVRRDVVYWVPRIGVPLSLLVRFVGKVFTDSTSCVHFRTRRPVLLPQRFLRPGTPPFSAHAPAAV